MLLGRTEVGETEGAKVGASVSGGFEGTPVGRVDGVTVVGLFVTG
jgi:hypothetical protein